MVIIAYVSSEGSGKSSQNFRCSHTQSMGKDEPCYMCQHLRKNAAFEHMRKYYSKASTLSV